MPARVSSVRRFWHRLVKREHCKWRVKSIIAVSPSFVSLAIAIHNALFGIFAGLNLLRRIECLGNHRREGGQSDGKEQEGKTGRTPSQSACL